MRIMRLNWTATIGIVVGISVSDPARSQSLDGGVVQFFESRLRDNSSAKSPTYQELLRVIDLIQGASAASISRLLPLLKSASVSTVPNLSSEAVFAYFEISRRKDGGVLLKSAVSDLASLSASGDERIRNGSATVLRTLAQSIPETVVPTLLLMLDDARYSGPVKSEMFRAVAESRLRSNLEIQAKLETYVESAIDSRAMQDNLYAVASCHFGTARMVDYAIKSLGASDEGVQIAATQALYGMGESARTRARPLWERLATEQSSSQKLRFLVDSAARGSLSESGKLPPPPPPPKLRGLP